MLEEVTDPLTLIDILIASLPFLSPYLLNEIDCCKFLNFPFPSVLILHWKFLDHRSRFPGKLVELPPKFSTNK